MRTADPNIGPSKSLNGAKSKLKWSQSTEDQPHHPVLKKREKKSFAGAMWTSSKEFEKLIITNMTIIRNRTQNVDTTG